MAFMWLFVRSVAAEPAAMMTAMPRIATGGIDSPKNTALITAEKAIAGAASPRKAELRK